MAKKKKTAIDIINPFGRVKGMYAGIHAWFYGRDIQNMHIFYTLFWLTILPLLILNFEGAKMVVVVLILLSPFWLIPALVLAIWHFWKDYIQLKFLADPKQDAQLYEIVVPKNVQKSPAAMELFFQGLLLAQGETTDFDRNWKGRVRPWFSLEIMGKNGEVKMYIWMWKRYTEHVEAQLYAQFPEVELRAVEDYASQVIFDEKKHFAWGMRYKLEQDEALPIKTYFDYGLHENADKWETKIDPMVNLLEKFALPGPGEQMWMQILFQKSERKIVEEAEKMIEKIHSDRATEYPSMADPEEMVKGFPILLPGDREKVDAIQRASKKPSFDCIIRSLYFTELENITTLRIQSLVKMFINYSGHNSFGLDGSASGGDWPWEKYTLPHWPTVIRSFMSAYRLRSGFHAPFKRATITLTTEELATLFHFPSEESAVPGMEKAQAKSAAPPTNLPT